MKAKTASLPPPPAKNGAPETSTMTAPPPHQMSKKELESAFAAYDKADARVEEARKALEKALGDRGVIVEEIAHGTGSRGPFSYKGRQLTIICRTDKETGESTWFFKGPTKGGVIQVG